MYEFYHYVLCYNNSNIHNVMLQNLQFFCFVYKVIHWNLLVLNKINPFVV